MCFYDTQCHGAALDTDDGAAITFSAASAAVTAHRQLLLLLYTQCGQHMHRHKVPQTHLAAAQYWQRNIAPGGSATLATYEWLAVCPTDIRRAVGVLVTAEAGWMYLRHGSSACQSSAVLGELVVTAACLGELVTEGLRDQLTKPPLCFPWNRC